MKASVKPRSPALNAVGTAQVHGYRKSLFWWNVWSGSRKAARQSHTWQRDLRVSLGSKHKRGRLQQRTMLRQSIFQLIARCNRFERTPVLGDTTLSNAEEVINGSRYAAKRSLGDDEDEVTLAKYLVH